MAALRCRLLVLCAIAVPAIVLHVEAKSKSTEPPSLISQPKRVTPFKGDETQERIELPCVALGEPKPEYRWEKNGKDLDVVSSNNIIFLPGIGSITINDPTLDDEGYYQCFATNSFGTSVSILALVQKAVLETFPNVVEPKRHTPTVGYSLTLKCHVPKSIPADVSVMWALTDRSSATSSDDMQVVVDDQRVTKDFDGNLHFTNIKETDRTPPGTVYMCMVLNPSLRSMVQGDDQTIEPQSSGAVSNIPVERMWTSPTEITALLGQPLKIKCIFSGNPTPKVGWNRKGKDVSLFDNIYIKSYGMELVIDKVEFKDAGEYECHGVNDVTRTRQTNRFNVNVEASPYWIDEPKDVVAGVEEKAVFKCNVGGDPMPDIKWYINGQPIDQVPPNPRRTVYRLQIIYKNLTQSDQQVIQCNASNIHGYLWADVFLNVLAEKPEMIPNGRDKVKVAEEQSLSIVCNTTGKPTPKITWYKGTQVLEGAHFDVTDEGTLIIKEVMVQDAGVYTCKARNRFGYAEQKTRVTVTLKTEIKDKTPDGDKIAGTNIELRCGAKTDPNEIERLRVTWLYEGLAIRPNSSRHLVDNDELTLTIFDSVARDSGYYMCNVSNGIDSAQGTIKITVKDKPDRPIGVTVTKCWQHVATVAWKNTSDNNSPITQYIIQYNTTFTPSSWSLGSRGVADARNSTLTLSPWANYTFRVIAVNDVGQSLPSDITEVCESGPALPEKQPQGVHTPTHKQKYLVVQWDEMPQIDQNGPDYRYKVTIRRAGQTDDPLNFVVRDYRVTSIEVPVNTVFEPYDVTVESVNRVGACLTQPQTVRGFSGESEPNLVPQDFRLDPARNVTATSATFLWTAVDTKSEHMFGVFHGYRIQFWKTGQKRDTLTEVEIPKTSAGRRRRATMKTERHTVSSLPPYSNLTVQVSVANTHYIGPPSNRVYVETPEGVPSKVSYLTARIKGANHFVLNWGEPKHHNGILIGYDIQYRKVNENELGFKSQIIQINDVKRRYFVLEGLLNDQEYRVYIWAKTRVGHSKVFYIDVVTGRGGVPAKPEFAFDHVGETSFNVTWHKVAEGAQTMGYHHHVEYRKRGEKNWAQTHKETTHLWQEVTNLTPGTMYHVKVIATTAEGAYPSESTMQNVTTLSAAHVVHHIATAGWFIGMMATIAILLLILIIVCIIKRNRGDKYHVQEKERLRGADLDNGNHMDFNPYLDHGDDNSIGKKSGGSGDHPHVPTHGSDVDSMEEYAGVDPSKFNEDGSFIGQYGDKGQSGDRNERPPMSTFM